MRRRVRTMAAGLAALGILILGVLNLPVVSRALDSPCHGREHAAGGGPYCLDCHRRFPHGP